MVKCISALMTEWNAKKLMTHFPKKNLLVRGINKGKPGLCRYSERNQTYMDDAIVADGAKTVKHHWIDLDEIRNDDFDVSVDALIFPFVVALASGKSVQKALNFSK